MRKALIYIITCIVLQLNAQDIAGSYIQTKHLSGNTYSIAVTLINDASLNISRPSIKLNLGDGNTGTFTLNSVASINGMNIKKYSGTHSYPGAGNYNVTYLDSFRLVGIKNMTNSQTQKSSISTLIKINNSPTNSSPTIQNDPINFTVSGNSVCYNPTCIDVDGDSISYAMNNCFGLNYYLPNNASIDNTGKFSFSKDSIGLYAFSIIITEWRKGTNNIYTINGTSQIDFVMNITPTIGIKELAGSQVSCNLFPNPVRNKLQLQFIDEASKSIVLTNCQGKVQFEMKTNGLCQEVNVSALNPGLYILTVSSNQHCTAFKIIKD